MLINGLGFISAQNLDHIIAFLMQGSQIDTCLQALYRDHTVKEFAIDLDLK